MRAWCLAPGRCWPPSPGGEVAIDLQAVTTLKPGDPQICPVPKPDKEGKGERGSARDYEDQIKALVNPDAPTPRGYGVALINPVTGNPVFFDDCQRRTVAMIEAKGPGTARVIEASHGRRFRTNVEGRFLDQGERQLQAADGRPVIWFCAEKRTADFLRQLFNEQDKERARIVVAWIPFAGRRR